MIEFVAKRSSGVGAAGPFLRRQSVRPPLGGLRTKGVVGDGRAGQFWNRVQN
jgi:hypothetical protein